MKLGCQTHFENNTYPLSLFPALKALGVDFIRDEIPWKYVETTKGMYTFPAPLPEYMAAAQANGIPVLFTADFTNPLYDDNFFPYSPAGRQGFVNYVLAVLAQFPQITMCEVYNEPDSNTFTKGPAWFNAPYYFALLLKEVYGAVKEKYPAMTIVSGGLSAADIPFIREMAAWGVNSAINWFGLHPYAWDESFPWYVGQVAAARGEHGSLACTEWGNIDSPDQLVRGAVLHAASNVQLSSWYQGYGAAGALVTAAGLTDTGNAFMAVKAELALGMPVRQNVGDLACFVYRFGTSDNYVVWGRYGNALATNGTCFNSQGQSIAMPATLSFSPVFVRGATHLTVAASAWLDNSRINFGGANWAYLSDRGAGVVVPCQIQSYGSGLFDECYGDALNTPYFQIGNTNVVEPYRSTPILRWTAPKVIASLVAQIYIAVPHTQSTGCDFSVLHNGATVFSGQVPGGSVGNFSPAIAGVLAGDTIDFRYAATSGNATYSNFTTEANLIGSHGP